MSEAFNGGPLLFRWLLTHFFPTLKTPIEDKKRSTSTKWASGAGNRQYLSLKAAICATFHTCCSARSCNFFHSTANFELTTFKKKFGVNHCNSAGCRPPGGNATHSPSRCNKPKYFSCDRRPTKYAAIRADVRQQTMESRWLTNNHFVFCCCCCRWTGVGTRVGRRVEGKVVTDGNFMI